MDVWRGAPNAWQQKLLGHNHVETTMVYTHVLNRGGQDVQPATAAPQRSTMRHASRHRGASGSQGAR